MKIIDFSLGQQQFYGHLQRVQNKHVISLTDVNEINNFFILFYCRSTQKRFKKKK